MLFYLVSKGKRSDDESARPKKMKYRDIHDPGGDPADASGRFSGQDERHQRSILR